MYLQNFCNYRKDDQWLIVMVDLRRFVEVDRKQISIHEMENILLLFRTNKKQIELFSDYNIDFTIVIPSDQTSDRIS